MFILLNKLYSPTFRHCAHRNTRKSQSTQTEAQARSQGNRDEQPCLLIFLMLLAAASADEVFAVRLDRSRGRSWFNRLAATAGRTGHFDQEDRRCMHAPKLEMLTRRNKCPIGCTHCLQARGLFLLFCHKHCSHDICMFACRCLRFSSF